MIGDQKVSVWITWLRFFLVHEEFKGFYHKVDFGWITLQQTNISPGRCVFVFFPRTATISQERKQKNHHSHRDGGASFWIGFCWFSNSKPWKNKKPRGRHEPWNPDWFMTGSLTRWFKVTFSSSSWRSLNPFKGSLRHPKKEKVTLNRQENGLL